MNDISIKSGSPLPVKNPAEERDKKLNKPANNLNPYLPMRCLKA
jgi:hypothetical protein